MELTEKEVDTAYTAINFDTRDLPAKYEDFNMGSNSLSDQNEAKNTDGYSEVSFDPKWNKNIMLREVASKIGTYKCKISVALAPVLGGIVAFILLAVLLVRVSELQTTIEHLQPQTSSLPQANTTG